MAIKSKLFTGKDTFDLDKQQWDWRSANPAAVVTKVHSDETLPLEMTCRRYGERIITPDLVVLRRLEYED
jgi:hypothetical protein